jgi:hypothetical protein
MSSRPLGARELDLKGFTYFVFFARKHAVLLTISRVLLLVIDLAFPHHDNELAQSKA